VATISVIFLSINWPKFWFKVVTKWTN